jgi:chromosome segregation ATPase
MNRNCRRNHGSADRISGVNGPDIAAVYRLLTEVARQLGEVAQQVSEIAQRVTAHDRRFEQIDRRFEQIDQRFEQMELRFEQIDARFDRHVNRIDELAADIAGLREQVTRDITDLRETVALYHHSVVGHGIQFSEVERRPLRLERHLGLPPLEPGERIL